MMNLPEVFALVPTSNFFLTFLMYIHYLELLLQFYSSKFNESFNFLSLILLIIVNGPGQNFQQFFYVIHLIELFSNSFFEYPKTGNDFIFIVVLIS